MRFVGLNFNDSSSFIGWIEVRRCSWIALSRFLLFNLSHFLRLCCPKNFRLYLLDFILFYFSLSFSSTFSSFVLSCLADLIFVIYLYQRWIYKVDKKRVNEFGFGGEDDQVVAETDATKEEENTTTEEEKKTNWFGFL